MKIPISSDLLLSLENADSDQDRMALLAELDAIQLGFLVVLSRALANKERLKKLSHAQVLGVVENLALSCTSPSELDDLKESLVTVNWPGVLEVVEALGYTPASESEIRQRYYLNALGEWDKESAFRPEPSRSQFLTGAFATGAYREHAEHELTLHLIARNDDESIKIQGYSGVGKTALVTRLTLLFNRPSTLLLTKNKQNILAMMPTIGSLVRAWDYAGLVQHVFDDNEGEIYWGRRIKHRPLPFNRYAELLGISPLNGQSPEAIARSATQTVFNYCTSVDRSLGVQHLPKHLGQYAPGPYIAIAEKLWSLIKEPNPRSIVPIHLRHMLKIIDEYDLRPPQGITHIILDESHDAFPCLLHVLERWNLAVIMLGDQHQATEHIGMAPPAPGIRQAALCQSLRVGKNADHLYNLVLSESPVAADFDQFRGVATHPTAIESLGPRKPFPDEPCTILCKDLWYAFLYARWLDQQGRPFRFFPETLTSISGLITEAMDYFRRSDAQRSRYQLIGFRDWQELVNVRGKTNGLTLVDREFRSGFKYSDWEALLQASQAPSDKKEYLIGLVTDSKSKEFPSVFLAPDVVLPYFYENNYMRTKHLNLLYTGLSRASQRLYIPAKEGEWLL